MFFVAWLLIILGLFALLLVSMVRDAFRSGEMRAWEVGLVLLVGGAALLFYGLTVLRDITH